MLTGSIEEIEFVVDEIGEPRHGLEPGFRRRFAEQFDAADQRFALARREAWRRHGRRRRDGMTHARRRRRRRTRRPARRQSSITSSITSAQASNVGDAAAVVAVAWRR